MDNVTFVHRRLVIPVIDALTGGPGVPAWRSIWNPAILNEYPDTPFAILDWSKVLANCDSLARKEARRYAKEAGAAHERGYDYLFLRAKTIAQALNNPVQLRKERWASQLLLDRKRGYKREAILDKYLGVDLFGKWVWGSMIKGGNTIGSPIDIVSMDNQSWRGEDAVRAGRHYFSDARYGACIVNGLRVKILGPEDTWHGIALGDGFEIWAEDLIEGCFEVAKHPALIKFRPARQSYQHWEKLPWEEIAEEAVPAIQENIPEALSSIEWLIRALDVGDRQELLALDPAMGEHPWLAGSIERGIGELLFRLSTTVPVPSSTYVVIPSPDDEYHSSLEAGQYVIKRMPIDSPSNIEAVEFGEPDEYANRLVVQFTVSGPDYRGKGCATPMPRSEMEGYDVVTCWENIKLAAGGQRGLQALRSSSEHVCQEPIQLSILQAWNPACVMAVPAKKWKVKGGDMDGDLLQADDCKNFPVIWEATSRLPVVDSLKVGKDKDGKPRPSSSLGGRTWVAAKSMTNEVGMATIITSAFWALFRNEVIWDALVMKVSSLIDDTTQKELGISPPTNAYEVWVMCNMLIKIMTDGFKTSVNMIAASGLLRRLQGTIIGVAEGMPGFTAWVRSLWAFRHGLPYLEGEELEEDDIDPSVKGETLVLQAMKRSKITEPYFAATITQIYLAARDTIQAYTDEAFSTKRGIMGWIVDHIKVRPLVFYVNWAQQVDDSDLVEAHGFYDVYLASSAGVNWNDASGEHSSVQMFVGQWREDCQDWASIAFGGNTSAAAAALWRISHLRGGPKSGAGAVFLGFPEEVRRIIAEKPGLKGQAGVRTKSVLIGFEKNCVLEVNLSKFGPIRVHVEAGVGRLQVIALTHTDHFYSDRPGYPDNLVGFIGEISQKLAAAGFSVPAEGDYTLELVQPDPKAKWHIAWFTPL